jgi:hypothetical protein
VTLEAEFGVVGEIRTELEEEGTEVPILAVEVVLVDQRRGAHQPRIRTTSVRVAPFLGAEDGGFLLGFAHEDHALGGGKPGSLLSGDLIFVLPLLKSDAGERMSFDEAFDGSHKVSGKGTHESRGSDRLAAMLTKESHHAAGILQAGDIGIEVHAVDALYLQSDVILQDRSEAVCYAHGGSFAVHGPLNRFGGPCHEVVITTSYYGWQTEPLLFP